MSDNQRSKGLSFAFIAATSLAFITTFARLTYDAGSTPFTLIVLRCVIGLVALYAISYFIVGTFRLPRAAWKSTLVAGIGLTMITFGYMSSVAYIPVGLAALIFYTFPLVVLAYEAMREGKLPGPRRLAIFLIAFAGLGFAIGPSLESLNPIGMALAFIGGLGSVVFLLAGAEASKHTEPLLVASYANLFLFPLALACLIVFDAYQLPKTDLGVIALGGAGLAYIIGITTQIMAVKFANTSDVSLVHNFEPVVSIAIAWIVLHETLSVIQLAGVALVISAIFAGTKISKNL